MESTVAGILVGYDGSAGSERALAWAAREARLRGTTLTVCHAWGPAYPARPTEVAALSQLARRSGEQTLAHGLRLAQRLMDASQVRPLLVPGAATAALCKQGDGADMVVVGSRGHSELAELLLGSVSSQVATHGRGPVVVVPGHWRTVPGHMPGPVVVGIDGSPSCEPAGAFAFEVAALHHVPVVAVCALADAPGILGGGRRVEEEFGHLMSLWEKEYPEVAVRRIVADGSPRAALLSAATQAQLLVVGSRGRGGMRGMLLGSVSQVLLRHAPCPLCVAHAHGAPGWQTGP